MRPCNAIFRGVLCLALLGCTGGTPTPPAQSTSQNSPAVSGNATDNTNQAAETAKLAETDSAIAGPDQKEDVAAPATTPSDKAGTAPQVSESMSRKEMLNLVGSGVVLVTAFDVLGKSYGFGSGCVVGDGVVLTNYHVVAQAITAKVQTKGEGDELLSKEMQVLGYRAVDDQNDLILLEVEGLPSNLYTFSVPESDSLEQHDQVFSMGHPDGLKFSTSPGFVSAMLKTSDMPEQLQTFLRNPSTEWIQTDAVISGGSSGGPLLDERGQLVGINTLVIPESRIALSVAARHVRELLSQKNHPVKSLPLPDADVITTRSLADVKAGFDREFEQLIMDVQQLQRTGQNDEMRKLIRRNNPGPACVRQCCELAEKHHGAAEAADAMKLSADVLKTSPSLATAGRHYLDELLAKAAADPALIPLSPRLMNSLFGLQYSDQLNSFLRGIMNSDQEDSLKGAAGVVLVNAMVTSNDESLTPEMLELAGQIKAQFGRQRFSTSTIEEILTPVLDAAKLAVGSLAPEITGTDADGETFRLSDYHGKVVMLDFWADWCPHCRNMYPEERELVEKFRDKPFALLGVNGDEPDRARRVIEAGTVTWRSWLDGSGGPIAEQFQIQAWPTILVLDATGRIRFSGLRGAELEAAIESLLSDSSGIVPQDILPYGASWSYLPLSGTDAPENWNQPDFDDAGWQSGTGSFAFPGQHESGTDLAQEEPGKRTISTLFRTKFDFRTDGAEPPKSLLMNIQFRDGVVVFLNGTEIYRGNLYADADPQGTAAFRATDREAKGIAIPVRSDVLKPERNCLAVSLHQHSAYSASPLLSVSLGRIPDLAEQVDTLPSSAKSSLCRMIAHAGTEIPWAAAILEKLQTDKSESVRISAAISAGMNDFRIRMSALTEPEAHQKLFANVILMNRDAWQIAESTRFTSAQYTDARRIANAAYVLQSRIHPELRPGVTGIENTLGVALYRCGQNEAAVKMLKNSVRKNGENPVDAGFLALTCHQLGNKEEAQKHKTLFDDLLKQEEWQHDPHAASLRKELQSLPAE